jgi:hypothetical protein
MSHELKNYRKITNSSKYVNFPHIFKMDLRNSDNMFRKLSLRNFKIHIVFYGRRCNSKLVAETTHPIGVSI